jgi:3-dehydroquinate synthase
MKYPHSKYEQKITVPFDYPVYFTRHIFDAENPLLAEVVDRRHENRRHRAMVYVDSGVVDTTPGIIARIENYCRDHEDKLRLAGRPETVVGGEYAKTGWDEVRKIIASLGNNNMCRQSCVIAVGGGGVLDMVGFACSLIHRGVRLIRAPTTVLAQNDAGVGVKNGMNEHKAKNFVGTFSPPFAVINDFEFLSTLKQKDWVGGISEAFKVAIVKDAAFFDSLCRNASLLRTRDVPSMEDLIQRCANLHLDHIRTSGDPFEFGAARPLDFGHWSAHRVELMSGYEVGHGQAVSIGIALDSWYAFKKRLISETEMDKIITGLLESGLPIWTSLLERPDANGKPEILAGLEQFREHLGGELTITLPKSIGQKCEVHEMDTRIIEDGIAFLKKRYESCVKSNPALADSARVV